MINEIIRKTNYIINMKMIYDKENDKVICPRCKSDNVYIKCGMFCDLYICNNCGYESRDIE